MIFFALSRAFLRTITKMRKYIRLYQIISQRQHFRIIVSHHSCVLRKKCVEVGVSVDTVILCRLLCCHKADHGSDIAESRLDVGNGICMMLRSPTRLRVIPCQRAAIRAAASPAFWVTDLTCRILCRSKFQRTTKTRMTSTIIIKIIVYIIHT